MEYLPEYHGDACEGYYLLIHDRMTGEFREYKYPVKKDITTLGRENKSISFVCPNSSKLYTFRLFF